MPNACKRNMPYSVIVSPSGLARNNRATWSNMNIPSKGIVDIHLSSTMILGFDGAWTLFDILGTSRRPDIALSGSRKDRRPNPADHEWLFLFLPGPQWGEEWALGDRTGLATTLMSPLVCLDKFSILENYQQNVLFIIMIIVKLMTYIDYSVCMVYASVYMVNIRYIISGGGGGSNYTHKCLSFSKDR